MKISFFLTASIFEPFFYLLLHPGFSTFVSFGRTLWLLDVTENSDRRTAFDLFNLLLGSGMDDPKIRSAP